MSEPLFGRGGPLDRFELRRVRFDLALHEPVRLPPFPGAVLRSGFGRALRAAACSTGADDCSGCLLRLACAYSYCFETPVPPGSPRLARAEKAPHPFMLHAPSGGDLAAGDPLSPELVLVGRAAGYLPWFVLAFRLLGQAGLAPRGGRFELLQAVDIGTAGERVVYQAGGGIGQFGPPLTWRAIAGRAVRRRRLAIRFLTPFRAVRGGRKVGVELTFADFFMPLLRRVSLLAHFHCGFDLPADFAGLKAQAEQIETVGRALTWTPYGITSGRQGEDIDLSGVIGTAAFRGPVGPLMPYLALGELVGAGKGTAYGCGGYGVG